MYIPISALIVAGALALVVLALAWRRRRDRRDDLTAPPPARAVPPPPRAWPAAAAPVGDLPAEVAAEVRELMAADRKIEAIKVARAATGLSLADAKALVERMG
jgi:large subunit ribosomal protein L7/L12